MLSMANRSSLNQISRQVTILRLVFWVVFWGKINSGIIVIYSNFCPEIRLISHRIHGTGISTYIYIVDCYEVNL